MTTFTQAEKEQIMEGIRKHIRPLTMFEQADNMKVDPGYCSFSVEIIPSMMNLYGSVHGGTLFALCDIAAGISVYAFGTTSVTLQSNINYMKAATSGTLFIEGKSVHHGHKTSVCQVTIHDQNHQLIATASMTMFITGNVL